MLKKFLKVVFGTKMKSNTFNTQSLVNLLDDGYYLELDAFTNKGAIYKSSNEEVEKDKDDLYTYKFCNKEGNIKWFTKKDVIMFTNLNKKKIVLKKHPEFEHKIENEIGIEVQDGNKK